MNKATMQLILDWYKVEVERPVATKGGEGSSSGGVRTGR